MNDRLPDEAVPIYSYLVGTEFYCDHARRNQALVGVARRLWRDGLNVDHVDMIHAHAYEVAKLRDYDDPERLFASWIQRVKHMEILEEIGLLQNRAQKVEHAAIITSRITGAPLAEVRELARRLLA